MKDNKPDKTPKRSNAQKTLELMNLVFTRNPVGRPRMYTKSEELEKEIVEYVKYCYDDGIKLTISGLILWCGFSDRSSFYAYEKNLEFKHTIKKARALLAMHYEAQTQEAFPQGAIFMLKNLGFSAEEEIEKTVKTKLRVFVGGDPAKAPAPLPKHDDKDYTDYDDI